MKGLSGMDAAKELHSSQGSFTMVNVADSTNVDVRFCTFKFFFRHGYIPYYSALPFGESTGLRF